MNKPEKFTATDNYLCHPAARIQRLLAVQDRAEREGDQQALADAKDGLQRIAITVNTLMPMFGLQAAVSAMRGPEDEEYHDH